MLGNFSEVLYKIVAFLNDWLWTPLPYVLLLVGIFFTIVTGFVQFTSFGRAFKEIFSKESRENHFSSKNINSLQAFMTGVASRVGMGNIAGVAAAIVSGGPGAVFWMWCTALIGMATSIIENSLSQVYKVKDENGNFVGGPAFYIRQGLKSPFLGIIFSLSLVFTYGFAFNGIQANQMANAFNNSWDISIYTTGIFLVIISIPIVFGSVKFISNISSIIVPVMAIIYLILALVVIYLHHDKLIDVFLLIFNEAFNFNSAIGGAIGTAIIYGVKRGLYSNEAGMGSSPNAAAMADVSHPIKQGYVQMVGVFIDTIVICSLTAFIILVTGLYKTSELTGAALTQQSVSSTIGDWSVHLMSIIIFLFAFSSIIGNYAYSISGITYITKNPVVKFIVKIIVLVFIFWGSISASGIVWDFADLSMALMTFINLFAIIILTPRALEVIRDYNEQVKEGKNPVFDARKYESIYTKLEDKDIWIK